MASCGPRHWVWLAQVCQEQTRKQPGELLLVAWLRKSLHCEPFSRTVGCSVWFGLFFSVLKIECRTLQIPGKCSSLNFIPWLVYSQPVYTKCIWIRNSPSKVWSSRTYIFRLLKLSHNKGQFLGSFSLCGLPRKCSWDFRNSVQSQHLTASSGVSLPPVWLFQLSCFSVFCLTHLFLSTFGVLSWKVHTSISHWLRRRGTTCHNSSFSCLKLHPTPLLYLSSVCQEVRLKMREVTCFVVFQKPFPRQYRTSHKKKCSRFLMSTPILASSCGILNFCPCPSWPSSWLPIVFSKRWCVYEKMLLLLLKKLSFKLVEIDLQVCNQSVGHAFKDNRKSSTLYHEKLFGVIY